MTTDDFTLVGPACFVLEREQWFAGYRSGALEIQALTWEDVRVRDHGDTAVAIGIRTQEAAYQGNPAGGRFRGTHIATRRDGRWAMASVHLSPMAGAPAR
jgi:ketosteroid isomerase-like protein